MYQMMAGRILVLLLASILSYWWSFKDTPELDNVPNAWMYRISFGLVIMRGIAALVFDGFGLFPLPPAP